MKKAIHIFIIASLVLGSVWLAASAEEKVKDETKVTGRSVSGVQTVKEAKGSSKFYEYRDVPKDVIFNALDLNVQKGDIFAVVRASRIRQADARYDLSVGKYGTYQIDLGYDQIPHRFSFSGKTLYTEDRIGFLAFPDGLRTLLQNAVGDGSANSTLYMPTARTLLKTFLPGAHGIDLGIQRNKYSLNFSVTPSVPLTLNLSASRETREGNRPLGTALGTSFTIELPEPIRYTTSQLNATAELSEKWGTAQAGYYLSLFDNEVESLTWDNPYRLTSQFMSSGDNRTATGRMALAPSNSYQKFYFNGSARLLKFTWIHAAASYGLMNQNASLLPYTANAAIASNPLGYSGALTPPRSSAEALAHTLNLDFSLNSRILSWVYLTAGYRYYDFANKTEALTIPGLSPYDQSWSTGPVSNLIYSYWRTKLYANLTFNLFASTALNVGYDYSKIDRIFSGEAGETPGTEEQENYDKEGTFKVSLDSNPLDWLDLRVSYLTAKRDWSLDGKVFIYAPFFNFKRFYVASRDRQGLNLLVGIDPIKNLNVQFSYLFGKDEYPKSDYGLKGADFAVYGVDLSYALTQSASLFGFYSYEVYKTNQGARQSGSTFSPDAGDDWNAAIKDVINTFGAGLNIVLKKDLLNLDLCSTYSKAKGSVGLSSPPGGTVLTAAVLPFTNSLDGTKLLSLQAKLMWKMMTHFSIAAAYWYEQYTLNDIVNDNPLVDGIIPASIPGGASASTSIYLGAIAPSYRYHVATLNFICTW
jgi:MtrB/PioB family decaheme-associated outer membrane protein